tara:strand:- start:188 stop:562 length:375 start_codon:yes stop_codon:yes gene_type:complete
MPDNRDFRVRAFLYIKKEGVARGLFNHIQGVMGEAVDINAGEPNAEMKQLELNTSWTVFCDLCFPPDKQSEAEGLFNHSKNTARKHGKLLPNPDDDIDTGSVSIERCGHRTKQSCTVTETYKVA